MSEKTGISWTDATFNPWWGCQKVSPACDHCYAERDARRHAPGMVLWGVDSDRRTFGDKHWKGPGDWAKRMFLACKTCGWRGDPPRGPGPKRAGALAYYSCPACSADVYPARRRVFCASMADWLDLDAPISEFVRLLDLIRTTPELDWLLLSKRIGNWRKRMDEARSFIVGTSQMQTSEPALAEWIGRWLDGTPPANVWLGATVIDQAEADRDIPKLLAVPARVRFLSIEPMLGPIDLRQLRGFHNGATPQTHDCLSGHSSDTPWGYVRDKRPDPFGRGQVHWVIAGGESGPHARPMHPDWVRSLRDQCAAAGVPFHFKQWGEWIPYEESAQPPFYHSQHGHEIDGHAFPDFESDDGRQQREWHCDYVEQILARRVGKAAAGRLLDGVEHNGFPA